MSESIFNKVTDLRLVVKRRLWDKCFPMNFAILKSIFFTEHLWKTSSDSNIKLQTFHFYQS